MNNDIQVAKQAFDGEENRGGVESDKKNNLGPSKVFKTEFIDVFLQMERDFWTLETINN